MTEGYPVGLVACDLNIYIAPPMDEAASLRLFAGLRRSMSGQGLIRFDHDQDSQVCRLDNGGNKPTADERVVKLVKGRTLQVIWGRNTPLDVAKELARITAAELVRTIELIQIDNFDSQLHLDVKSTGNAYDRIAAFAYNQDTVGSFYNAMAKKVDGFHVGDNDLHILFFIGESQTGSIRIKGNTTLKEIITGQFDDDPLRVFFGIQESRIPDGPDAFVANIEGHLERVHLLARSVLVPTLVDKMQTKPAGTTD